MNNDFEWFKEGWIDIEIGINTPLSDDFVPNDPAPVSVFEGSKYFSFGDATVYNPSFEEGDKIYWRFKTHDDKFNVRFRIGSNVTSEGKTSDSGIYNVQANGSYTLLFMNNDFEWSREGWIDIEIGINTPLSDGSDPTEPDPTDPDPTEPDPTEPDPTEPDPESNEPTNIIPIFIGIIVSIGVIGLIIYLIIHPTRNHKIYPQSISQKVPRPIVQQTPRKINENIKFCIECGQPSKKESKFCKECGTEMVL